VASKYNEVRASPHSRLPPCYQPKQGSFTYLWRMKGGAKFGSFFKKLKIFLKILKNCLTLIFDMIIIENDRLEN